MNFCAISQNFSRFLSFFVIFFFHDFLFSIFEFFFLIFIFQVLMFACFPYCFGWLVVSVANSVHYIYLSRLLVGISHALLTTTVYTVEISSREMRGTYSLLESVLRCFGCLLIYALGFALRWKQIAIFAPLVPICAFICAIFLAPESPVYLLRKQR